MLKSLEITGFKLFERLTLPTLGRLNLFVGENNTGKSCLLEAIGMYAGRNPVPDIVQTAESRSPEVLRSWEIGGLNEVETSLVHPIFDLFHRVEGKPTAGISIGEIGESFPLKVDFQWHHVITDEGIRYIPAEAGDLVQQPTEMALRVFQGNEQVGLITRRMLPWRNRTLTGRLNISDPYGIAFLPASGFTDEKAASLWDTLVQGPGQDIVLDWLRIIEPRVEGLVYIAGRLRSRVALIKLAGEGRIPLRSMGDGVTRLFHIGLAMASASGGILLIDEFENGLHWKAQERIWHALAEAALRFRVQIFSTTHSRDCIEGFTKASFALGLADSFIYRLERLHGEIFATDLPIFNVDAALRQHSEVR